MFIFKALSIKDYYDQTMTAAAFLKAISNGQRRFIGLDFEYPEGFQNKNFSGCIFERCFLYVDFEGSNFSNAQFLACNLKRDPTGELQPDQCGDEKLFGGIS